MAGITVSLRGTPHANYSLADGHTRIGRWPGNAIVLKSWRISGAHAVLIQAGAALTIEDLDSRNGTYIAGARIKRAELNDGSVVRIGDYELTVVAHQAARAYEPTLFVRSNPNVRQAYLQRLNGLPEDQVIGLNKVVTVLGTPGACVVTFIRRADEFAVRFTDGVTPARLNGTALTGTPVRLQAGDILEMEGGRLQFRTRDAVSTWPARPSGHPPSAGST